MSQEEYEEDGDRVDCEKCRPLDTGSRICGTRHPGVTTSLSEGSSDTAGGATRRTPDR